MNAYLVRLDEEQNNPKELVGFFVAEDEVHLSRLVDECCESPGCEYLELEAGGIFWSQSVNYFVPYSGLDEMAPALPGGATSTGSWGSALYDENTGEWLPLDSDV